MTKTVKGAMTILRLQWDANTYGELSEGNMRLIRINARQDGWTGTESEAVLTLEGKANCYSGAKFDPPTVRCFAWEGFAYSNPYRKTFVTFLHPGDILEIHWIGSNNNQQLDAAKLHHDQVSMVIGRGKRLLLKSCFRSTTSTKASKG